MKITAFILPLCVVFTLWAAPEDSLGVEEGKTYTAALDTTDSLHIVVPHKELIADQELIMPKKRNPLVSTGLSALIPGAGQIYCKRRVRGSLFLAAEAVWVLVAINRFQRYKYSMMNNIDYYQREIELNYDAMLLSVNDPDVYTTHYGQYINAQMSHDLAQYRRDNGRYVFYHCIGWAGGIYFWNVLDALQSSRFFHSVKPKKPAAAAGLSAIPFLGLGQIYNGSFAKAGFVFTIQTMLAFMAFNYNELMNDCINKSNQVKNTISVSSPEKDARFYEWDREYRTAFKNRNTYLWYLVLFYFYGILDAAVDAHLHDYRIKIRLEPEIEKNEKAVSLNISFGF